MATYSVKRKVTLKEDDSSQDTMAVSRKTNEELLKAVDSISRTSNATKFFDFVLKTFGGLTIFTLKGLFKLLKGLCAGVAGFGAGVYLSKSIASAYLFSVNFLNGGLRSFFSRHLVILGNRLKQLITPILPWDNYYTTAFKMVSKDPVFKAGTGSGGRFSPRRYIAFSILACLMSIIFFKAFTILYGSKNNKNKSEASEQYGNLYIKKQILETDMMFNQLSRIVEGGTDEQSGTNMIVGVASKAFDVCSKMIEMIRVGTADFLDSHSNFIAAILICAGFVSTLHYYIPAYLKFARSVVQTYGKTVAYFLY